MIVFGNSSTTQSINIATSQIQFLGRWQTDPQNGKWSGWGGTQMVFKVSHTTYIDVVAYCLDPDGTALCFLTYSIDNSSDAKTVVYLSSAAATTNGLVKGRITIPDTNQHTVILCLAGLNANMYNVTGKTVAYSFIVQSGGNISTWQQGNYIIQTVGDSWMAQEADWPRLMDQSTWSLYPIASGGLKCSDMDTQYNFNYSGDDALSDPNADAVIVSFGVNDYNASVTQAAFETSMLSLVDKIRAKQSTAPIVLIRVPNNVGAAKTYGQYGTNMSNVAAARSNVYYVDTTSLDNTITWADGDPNHLDGAGKVLLADFVDAELKTILGL